MVELEGKTALITGGAGGIGAACCRRFAAAGARVVIADIDRDGAHALAAELGPASRAIGLDVGSEASWDAAIAGLSEIEGRLDALVNNAGILRRTPIADGDPDLYRKVVEVNQVGAYLGMRAVAPTMIAAAGGAIVNISSIDGIIGMPNMAAYVATKWAVRGMTKVAALELGPHGIRCNSVHPGYVDTPMLRDGLSESATAAITASVPSGRLADPAEIAAVCAFLASDEGSYCNGAEIVVDGGVISGFRPPTS